MQTRAVSPAIGVVILVAITFVASLGAAEVTLNISERIFNQGADAQIEYAQNLDPQETNLDQNKEIYFTELTVGSISNSEFLAVTARSDRQIDYDEDILRDGYPEDHGPSPDEATDLNFIDKGSLLFEKGDKVELSGLKPGDEIIVYGVFENGDYDQASSYTVADAIPNDTDKEITTNTVTHQLEIRSEDQNGDPVESEYRLDGSYSGTFTSSVTENLEEGEHSIRITSQEHGISKSRTVQLNSDTTETFVFSDTSQFNVAIVGGNSPVTAGEDLSVQTEIENTGNQGEYQTISLNVGSLGSGSKSLYVGGGESKFQSFDIPTSPSDSGTYSGTLRSDDDSDTSQFEVVDDTTTSPYFDVQIQSINDPVTAGDNVQVTVGIQNTGDEAGSQTISLDAGLIGSDSSSVTLAQGASTTKTFTLSTGSSDAGSYTATVESDDDQASQQFEVVDNSGNTGDPFIMTVDTTVSEGETANNEFLIKTGGGGVTKNLGPSDFDYSVEWSDGSEQGLSSNYKVEWDQPGVYQVEIYGDFPHIEYDRYLRISGVNEAESMKIVSIDQWGDIRWESFSESFRGARNMDGNFNDKPDLSQVKDTRRMFEYAEIFNADLSDWDMSNVEIYNGMFSGAKNFDSDLSGWDTSSAISMRSLFSDAESFSSDLSSWETGNLRQIDHIFAETNFEPNVGSWDTSSLTSMQGLAYQNSRFNSDISSWDTSNVENMHYAFWFATSFNQDLSGWDTSSVTRMTFMFGGAENFNGDITTWDTSNVEKITGMFSNAESFNRDISGWDVSSVEQSTDQYLDGMDSMFNGASSFNQDISSWCVEHLPGTYIDQFDRGAGFQGEDSKQPNWGQTC